MALNGLFCADVPLRNYSLTQTSLLLWRHATARTRRQNDRQKIRHAWTSNHSLSVQSVGLL